MVSTEKIQNDYIDYVLTEGEQPKSVYIFAKKHEFSEEEFYQHFVSFEGLDHSIW